MQKVTLHNIYYTELNPVTMTWCATAQVRPSDSRSNQKTSTKLSAPQIASLQRQQQRIGVRLLLESLLKKLAISDTLDESSFPYRLIESQYYLCFSHSSDSSKTPTHIQNEIESPYTPYIKVAVIISRHRASGIDIEVNTVKWQIATRFYHPNEMAILQTLPIIQRDNTIKWLWQIKESFIKIHQYTLAQGLGMDYSAIIPELIKAPKNNPHLLTMADDASGYLITAIPSQQTVIIY